MAIEEAKKTLDKIINKARIDLYKPVQIAEVLYRSRTLGDLDIAAIETYRNPSLRWRNDVTLRLLGKKSTSSARFQHDIWNESAMPAEKLAILDSENKLTEGAVERYIYLRFAERQSDVARVMAVIETSEPETFQIGELFAIFTRESGIKKSIDKAYEIIAYSLLDTIIANLEVTVTVTVPAKNKDLLNEFEELALILLGVNGSILQRTQEARIYRAGVTNAADSGLDMWANFGPAIQVKHLTLNPKAATAIVDQIETDNIIIVCKNAHYRTIETILKQIGWGRRVRGIITEDDLIKWYDRCLRGKFSGCLAIPLLSNLLNNFKSEFRSAVAVVEFLKERGYLQIDPPPLWKINHII